MSDWQKNATAKPAEEWSPVLGWDEDRGYSICYWFTHSSGNVHWSVNGTTGGPVKAPTHWRELPASPVRR